MTEFSDYFPASKPIIGTIRLPPLPGCVDSRGIDHAIRHAVANLRVLEDGGVDGVLINNENDRPLRTSAGAETVAAMTRITRAVVQESESTVVGCEILLNDPRAALATAHMAGAEFVRAGFFVDRMKCPHHGEFEVNPDALLAYRSEIGADNVLIFADIQGRHGTMIELQSLEDSARLARRKGADALVVTGDEDDGAPTAQYLRQSSGWNLPVLTGSGFNCENGVALLAECDGAIVDADVASNGVVDPAALTRLMVGAGYGPVLN